MAAALERAARGACAIRGRRDADPRSRRPGFAPDRSADAEPAGRYGRGRAPGGRGRRAGPSRGLRGPGAGRAVPVAVGGLGRCLPAAGRPGGRTARPSGGAGAGTRAVAACGAVWSPDHLGRNAPGAPAAGGEAHDRGPGDVTLRAGVWGCGSGVIVTPRNGAHPVDCTGVAGREVSYRPAPVPGLASVGKTIQRGRLGDTQERG